MNLSADTRLAVLLVLYMLCCCLLLFVLQIVAMFVSLNFAWPEELQQLYSAMSVFNFNIQITAPEVSSNPLCQCLPSASS